MKNILPLLLTAILPLQMFSGERTAEDTLYTRLSVAETPADSLIILTDLYDLTQRATSNKIGMTAIEVAFRAKDSQAGLDIIRNQANRYMMNDSILRMLRDKTMKWPESEDRRETLTFINMMDNMRRGRYGDEVEHEKLLEDILDRMGNNMSDDIYERISLLHGICMLLSTNTNSELLNVYMDSLGSLVRRLPLTSFSIRNAYNVHAATSYSNVNPAKAIESDMRLISDVEKLEKYYHDRGRKFRNYDAAYYTIYTRLLTNYEQLTPSQVEDYYSKAKMYLDRDSAILRTYNRFPGPDIFYSMYHKDYANAAKLLKSSVIPAPRQLRAAGRLLECADSLKDDKLIIEASRAYADILEKELHTRAIGSYRELQVAYSLYDLKHNLGLMEKERTEKYARIQRLIILAGAVLLVILVILVLMLRNKSHKNRVMAENLKKSNELLKKESENLRISRAEALRARTQAEKANNMKTDFIKNMSYEVKLPLQVITEYSHLIADCVEATGLKHIRRFSDMLELNTELLSTIVTDVLRLSEMESSPIPVKPQVVNLRSLCGATLDSIRHRIKPGVSLTLDHDVPNIDLFTDPARVQQILNNLLTNAAKFTNEGSITLSYRENPQKTAVEFSVTDTGIGINIENREKIFERFVKLDHDTQGAGLGLTISRLIATRLGGELKLDTTYRGRGSRFVLILPRKAD